MGTGVQGPWPRALPPHSSKGPGTFWNALLNSLFEQERTLRSSAEVKQFLEIHLRPNDSHRQSTGTTP